MGKRWNKISCGGCYKLYDADNLIPDLKNNRYLCESCYEPRENISNQEKVKESYNNNSLREKENDEENLSEEDNLNDHKYLKGELRFKRGINT